MASNSSGDGSASKKICWDPRQKHFDGNNNKDNMNDNGDTTRHSHHHSLPNNDDKNDDNDNNNSDDGDDDEDEDDEVFTSQRHSLHQKSGNLNNTTTTTTKHHHNIDKDNISSEEQHRQRSSNNVDDGRRTREIGDEIEKKGKTYSQDKEDVHSYDKKNNDEDAVDNDGDDDERKMVKERKASMLESDHHFDDHEERQGKDNSLSKSRYHDSKSKPHTSVPSPAVSDTRTIKTEVRLPSESGFKQECDTLSEEKAGDASYSPSSSSGNSTSVAFKIELEFDHNRSRKVDSTTTDKLFHSNSNNEGSSFSKRSHDAKSLIADINSNRFGDKTAKNSSTRLIGDDFTHQTVLESEDALDSKYRRPEQSSPCSVPPDSPLYPSTSRSTAHDMKSAMLEDSGRDDNDVDNDSDQKSTTYSQFTGCSPYHHPGFQFPITMHNNRHPYLPIHSLHPSFRGMLIDHKGSPYPANHSLSSLTNRNNIPPQILLSHQHHQQQASAVSETSGLSSLNAPYLHHFAQYLPHLNTLPLPYISQETLSRFRQGSPRSSASVTPLSASLFNDEHSITPSSPYTSVNDPRGSYSRLAPTATTIGAHSRHRTAHHPSANSVAAAMTAAEVEAAAVAAAAAAAATAATESAPGSIISSRTLRARATFSPQPSRKIRIDSDQHANPIIKSDKECYDYRKWHQQLMPDSVSDRAYYSQIQNSRKDSYRNHNLPHYLQRGLVRSYSDDKNENDKLSSSDRNQTPPSSIRRDISQFSSESLYKHHHDIANESSISPSKANKSELNHYERAYYSEKMSANRDSHHYMKSLTHYSETNPSRSSPQNTIHDNITHRPESVDHSSLTNCTINRSVPNSSRDMSVHVDSTNYNIQIKPKRKSKKRSYDISSLIQSDDSENEDNDKTSPQKDSTDQLRQLSTSSSSSSSSPSKLIQPIEDSNLRHVISNSHSTSNIKDDSDLRLGKKSSPDLLTISIDAAKAQSIHQHHHVHHHHFYRRYFGASIEDVSPSKETGTTSSSPITPPPFTPPPSSDDIVPTGLIGISPTSSITTTDNNSQFIASLSSKSGPLGELANKRSSSIGIRPDLDSFERHRSEKSGANQLYHMQHMLKRFDPLRKKSL